MKKFFMVLFTASLLTFLSSTVCLADTLGTEIQRGNITAETLNRYLNYDKAGFLKEMADESIKVSVLPEYKGTLLILDEYTLAMKYDETGAFDRAYFWLGDTEGRSVITYNGLNFSNETLDTIKRFKAVNSNIDIGAGEYDIGIVEVFFDVQGTTLHIGNDLANWCWDWYFDGIGKGAYGFSVSRGLSVKAIRGSMVAPVLGQASQMVKLKIPSGTKMMTISLSEVSANFWKISSPLNKWMKVEIFNSANKNAARTFINKINPEYGKQTWINVPNSLQGKTVYMKTTVDGRLQGITTFKYLVQYSGITRDMGGEIRKAKASALIPSSLPIRIYRNRELDPTVVAGLDEAVTTWNEAWKRNNNAGKLIEFSNGGVCVDMLPSSYMLGSKDLGGFHNFANNVYLNPANVSVQAYLANKDIKSMKKVLAHELGHALGLDDLYITSQDGIVVGGITVDNRNCLMYGQNTSISDPTDREIGYLKLLHANTARIWVKSVPQPVMNASSTKPTPVSYSASPTPAPTTVTLAQNLIATGIDDLELLCSKNGWVYYSSDYSLMRMRKDGSGVGAAVRWP